MPLYDYTCPSCGHAFTLRQGFDDQPEAGCPRCGTTSRRRLTVPAVLYKGSGFYTTDYTRRSRDSSSADRAGEGAGAAGDQDGPSSGSGAHPHPHSP